MKEERSYEERRVFKSQLTCKTYAKGFPDSKEPKLTVWSIFKTTGGDIYCGRVVQRQDDGVYEVRNSSDKVLHEAEDFQKAHDYLMVEHHDRCVRAADIRRFKKKSKSKESNKDKDNAEQER